MWTDHRSQRGFTMIEMIVAMVIIAVGLTGVLIVFQSSVRSSSDPLVNKQLLAVAEEMLEEIELRPYDATVGGTSSGCARASFLRISDYNGYASSGQICDIDGVPIALLNGYSVNVSVAVETWQGITAKKVSVTVRRSANETLTLTSWRTPYGS